MIRVIFLVTPATVTGFCLRPFSKKNNLNGRAFTKTMRMETQTYKKKLVQVRGDAFVFICLNTLEFSKF